MFVFRDDIVSTEQCGSCGAGRSKSETHDLELLAHAAGAGRSKSETHDLELLAHASGAGRSKSETHDLELLAHAAGGYYNEYRNPIDYGHEYEHKYGHGGCEGMELAEAYVPRQKWDGLYPSMEGLKKGTIFPQLYRPYEKKCCRTGYYKTGLKETGVDVLE